MDYVLPVIFNTAGLKRLIRNLFYGNQKGIYLMVDSVDNKTNEKSGIKSVLETAVIQYIIFFLIFLIKNRVL
jgi:hypothetical protein